MNIAHRTSPIEHSIRLVCLDIGGVLVRILDDWRHTFTHTGTPLPGDLLDDPEVIKQLNRDLVEYESGRIDGDTFFESYAKRFRLPRERVTACFAAWIVHVHDGVDALIDAIAAAGVSVACLSNTNALHWRMMQSPGPVRLPLERFDHHFTSFEIGAMKPNDAIYEHVERVTDLAPAQIAFFDDLDANVAAAARRGWRAVRVDRGGNPPRQVAEHLRSMDVLLA